MESSWLKCIPRTLGVLGEDEAATLCIEVHLKAHQDKHELRPFNIEVRRGTAKRSTPTCITTIHTKKICIHILLSCIT